MEQAGDIGPTNERTMKRQDSGKSCRSIQRSSKRITISGARMSVSCSKRLSRKNSAAMRTQSCYGIKCGTLDLMTGIKADCFRGSQSPFLSPELYHAQLHVPKICDASQNSWSEETSRSKRNVKPLEWSSPSVTWASSCARSIACLFVFVGLYAGQNIFWRWKSTANFDSEPKLDLGKDLAGIL